MAKYEKLIKEIEGMIKIIKGSDIDVKKEVYNYFQKNTNIEDDDIHYLAEQLGLKPSILENTIYSVLSSFLYDTEQTPVDSEQLKKGIAVEMEHTSDPLIAQKIATDHLRESAKWKNPKYYDGLKIMEEQMKNG